MVGSAAGFDPHYRRRKLLEKRDHLLAPQLLAQNHRLGCVHPVKLEETLRRIHPNSANLFHRRSPFGEICNDLILAHAMPSGAVHPNTPINTHWHFSDAAASANVRFGADFVAKVGSGRGLAALSLCRSALIRRSRRRLYATLTLRNARSLSGRRLCGQRREPSQVLSDGGQNKLILGTSRAAQSESTELQDALQVCESHLDLFALMPRPLEALGSRERPGNVSGMLVDIARDLA